MRKKIWLFAIALTFISSFFLQSLTFAQSSGTATMSFNPESQTANVNDNVNVDTLVNAGSENILSVDAYIEYDSSMLEFVSVEDGDFFPIVTSEDISPGRLYIGAYVDDPATSKTGTGTYANVTFRALKEGTTIVEYFCDPSVNETSEVIRDDIDATNIIDCSGNGTAEIIISSSGGTTEPTSTPTPTQAVEDNETVGTTGGSGGDATDEVTELPQSGVLDNMLAISISGATLLLIGTALKFLL
ncbi:MAG: cohesin domain-containing protein [Patescibacteria group bacterium]